MKFINQRLILAVLFGLFTFIASSSFGIQSVAAQSAPADCTSIADFSASVSTTDELDSWLVCFNQAPAGTHTIALTKNIKLTQALTIIDNPHSAELIINGNGYQIDGNNTYRHFVILRNDVVFENIRLKYGRPRDAELSVCGDTICAGSVFVGAEANITLNDTVIYFSALYDEGSQGGGMYVRGTVTMYNSQVLDSRAAYGGNLYLDGGTLTAYNSSFADGYVQKWGGSIYSVGGPIALYNSTVGENGYDRSNQEGRVGGIYTDTTATFVNVTFGWNRAYNDSEGGTLYNASATEPIYLYNTLLLEPGYGTHCYGNIIAVNSMAEDDSCGDAIVIDEPTIESIHYNYAPGTTSYFTLTLHGKHPAIDAGDNDICQAAPINGIDQLGVARQQAWSGCDIGAIEHNGSDICTTTTAYAVDVSTADELSSWIACFNTAPAGTHTINLLQDITLATNTKPINNSDEATLLINGNGYTVDGAGSYRPFTVQDGDVVIANIVLQNGYGGVINCTDASWACGGALFVGPDGVVTLTEATLQNNSSDAGGAIGVDDGQLTIESSTLVGNAATTEGSAIFSIHGTVMIINSTLSDHAGIVYRGMWNSVEMTNSTLVADSADVAKAFQLTSGQIKMKNSIIAGQANENSCAFSTGGLFGKTRVRINSTNLADDGSCGNAVASDSINLGPLQDNGGATMTHALLAGSSAIDAGNDAICQAAPINNVDQRGTARSQGTACDVGAVEMQASELGGTAVSLSNSLASSNMSLVGILGGLLFLGIAGVVIRQRQM